MFWEVIKFLNTKFSTFYILNKIFKFLEMYKRNKFKNIFYILNTTTISFFKTFFSIFLISVYCL